MLGLHAHTPASTARGYRTPTARPEDGQPGEGERLNSGTPPLQQRKAPPPVTSSHHPPSVQRRLARAHAVGPVLGPHALTHRARETRVAEPWPPAPRDGRPGEGQRLTPHPRHDSGRPTPPGMASHHPRGTQPPAGHASERRSAGPPGPHTRAHSTWVADPDSPPRGRAAGGGERA